MVTANVKSHFTGKLGSADKPQAFANDAVSKDTWRKQDGAWKLHKSQLVSLTATIDGKPVG